MTSQQEHIELPAILPDPDGGFGPCPTVMTEEELIRFLRIPRSAAMKSLDVRDLVFELTCCGPPWSYSSDVVNRVNDTSRGSSSGSLSGRHCGSVIKRWSINTAPLPETWR